MFKYFLILLFVVIPLNSYSKESKFEKRLQKDIKKLSKISGFIDNNSKSYSEDEISDRQNTIVIIWNHGQRDGQKRIERCKKGTNEPEVIANLHNKEINGLKIKIYRMCSGVRGLNQPQMDRAWNLIDKEGNQNGLLEIVDYDGMRLFDKIKQHLRRQIVIDKIMNLEKKVFLILLWQANLVEVFYQYS